MKKVLKTITILSMVLIMVSCSGIIEEINTNSPVPLQTEENNTNTPGPLQTEETNTSELLQTKESTVPEESDTLELDTEEGEKPEADIIEQESDLAEDAYITEQITTAPVININEIPAYTGNAYAVINNNTPFFTDNELSAVSYEYYSDLDPLGRCGVCVASIGQDIMPTEVRGEIGNIKPSGWHTVKYPEIVDGNYLYNRCHLIGFQLAGENANVNNLITGTRYLNVEGMLPFENMVADFVKETGYHVMYRVTPVFSGDNLVADGVLIEAESVEDNGSGILFNVFCYNVQPGIIIDYASGNSVEDERIVAETEITPAEGSPVPEQKQEVAPAVTPEPQPPADSGTYAVNSKNGKIHITGKCPATGNGSSAMKAPVYFGTYGEAESYSVQIAPSQDKRKCGNCW